MFSHTGYMLAQTPEHSNSFFTTKQAAVGVVGRFIKTFYLTPATQSQMFQSNHVVGYDLQHVIIDLLAGQLQHHQLSGCQHLLQPQGTYPGKV